MSSTRIDIKYVKSHPDVTFDAVAGFYGLDLQRSGAKPGQFTALCPFHDDHKPSLSVNTEKNIFQCFPCGEKGNILDFVMKMEELDARSGAAKLAEICGIESAPANSERKPKKKLTPAQRLQEKSAQHGPEKAPETPKPDPPEAGSEPNPPKSEPAPKQEFTPYTRELPLDPEHPYLLKRVPNELTRELFELGYCKAGLMKNRIAIRVHDAEGDPLGYLGRWAEETVPENVTRWRFPEHFPKLDHLYNLHRIGEDAISVTIVESVWSVFRLHELGKAVMASLGHAVSPQHIALLNGRGIENVRLLFDGDDAGRKATSAAVTEMSKHFHVKAPEVPDGFKPHKATPDELKELLR